MLSHPFGFLVSAQSNGLVNYTVEDGLPSSEVYKAIQDDLGFMWFLTDHGISRFDGYEFKNYSSTNGLSDNVFFDAQKLEDGSIWILGLNGTVTIINPAIPSFDPYPFNDSLIKYGALCGVPNRLSIQNGSLSASYLFNTGYLAIDSFGVITQKPRRIEHDLLYSYHISNSGLFYYDYQYIGRPNHFTFKGPRSLRDYSIGFSLPGSDTKVLCFNTDSILIANRPDKDTILWQDHILDAGPLDSSLFWLSSKYNGIFIFNTNGELVDRKLNKLAVSDYFIDDRGNHWFTTLNNGVLLERSSLVQQYEFPNKDDNVIYQLAEHRGSLIVGHKNGNVSKVDKTGSLSLSLADYKSPAVLYSYNGVLYFTSGTNLCTYDQFLNILYTQTMVVNNINVVEEKIYLCYSNGYSVFDQDDSLATMYENKRLNTVVIYQGQNLMASDNGLYIEKQKDDSSFLDLSHLYKERVNDLLVIDSVLFLATHGDGLILIKNDKVIRRIFGNELSSNYINSIFSGNDSTVYLSTNSGITRLSFSNDYLNSSSAIINQFQGLTSIEVKDLQIIHDTLWIGTSQGLFFMPNKYFDRDHSITNYKLAVRKVLVNERSVSMNELSDLLHTDNKLQFQYSAISLGSAKSIVYRYKLKEVDKEWIYTKNRTANYSGLPSGNYEFVVQVKGENLNWEDQEVKVKIHINAPFWNTWWFISIAFGAGFLLIYLFFRLRILMYNKDLFRELLRQLLKRLKRKRTSIIVREGYNEVKILSQDISYVKSDGNYLKIVHRNGKTTIRHKIGDFLSVVPDPIEFIQVRRSYIVRIDKVEQLGKDYVIAAGHKIKVGSTYLEEFRKIKL